MANHIRDARVRLGISVTELARRCGVSRQAARAWDFASSSPKPEMLVKVAEVLETTVDQLVSCPGISTKPLSAQGAIIPVGREDSVDAILSECKVAVAAVLGIDERKVQLKVVLNYE